MTNNAKLIMHLFTILLKEQKLQILCNFFAEKHFFNKNLRQTTAEV